jgi:hypothetical protein
MEENILVHELGKCIKLRKNNKFYIIYEKDTIMNVILNEHIIKALNKYYCTQKINVLDELCSNNNVNVILYDTEDELSEKYDFEKHVLYFLKIIYFPHCYLPLARIFVNKIKIID